MAITVTCSCGKQLRAKDEHAGKRVKCPACGNAVSIPIKDDWFFQVMGDVMGPVDYAELRRHALAGLIKSDTLVRQGTDGDWVYPDRVKGLFDPAPAEESVLQKPAVTTAPPVSTPNDQGAPIQTDVPTSERPSKLGVKLGQYRLPILIGGSVAIVAIAVFFLLGRENPVYQGNTLAEWKEQTRDLDPKIRISAVRAFHGIASGGHLSAGLSALADVRANDADPGVRSAAVIAIGQVGYDLDPSAALPLLSEALTDRDASVVIETLRSLRGISGRVARLLNSVSPCVPMDLRCCSRFC